MTRILVTLALLLGVAGAAGIADAGPFYRAEAYHEDYHSNNPICYRYRQSCGSDARIGQIWGEEAGGKADAAKHQ